MFTIEDLKQGRCAVINDGTLEELREVLRSAFPNDKSVVENYIGYKYFSVMDENCWDCWNQITLPKQSVKDFITKELKRGDLIWVSDNDPDKRDTKAIYITKAEGANYPYITVARSDEDNYYAGNRFATGEYLYATKVEEPKEVCMTVEEIEKALNIKNLKIVK